jgi:DNA helicase HerA-like ATPase
MNNIVIGIFGLKGSGKTLFMVLLLYIEQQTGKKILANMIGLNFPSELLKIKDIVTLSEKLEGCTIGIDELHTIADSRKSGRVQNIQISNFFLQSRHRGVNIIYTEQYQSSDDKRIRQNTDIKIIARNLYIDSDKDGIPDVFEYTIIDTRTEEINTIKIYGKPIFSLYSDAELIDLYDHKK